MKLNILLIFPFGAALAARLLNRYWQAWVVWGGVALATFAGIWVASYEPARAPLETEFLTGRAFLFVAGASAVGFIAPELWAAVRAWVSRPRTVTIVFGIAAVVFIAFNPELLVPLGALAAVLYGISVMLRPFTRRGGGRR